MGNKTLVINQFRGLGDILFVIPIARKYISEGYKVIFPIDPIFLSIQKHFPDIEFINKEESIFNLECSKKTEQSNILFLPLRFADSLEGVSYTNCMLAKYKMTNLPMEMWRTLSWERDEVAEKKLFEIYKLQPNSRFNFISQRFLTTFNGVANIKVNNGLPNIELRYIEGFTLIDWIPLMQQAENIHVVSSSIMYLLDLIDLQAREISVYKRGTEPHKHYDYIFKKHNYKYI